MGAGGKGKGKSRGGKGTGKSAGKTADDPKWVAKKPTVLVTGASGYIAGHIIKTLLGKGYTVHGTVRAIDNPKAAEVKALFPAVSLFAADLVGGPDDFAKAAEGCTCIIHTASPATLENPSDGMKEIVEPAVKGTEAVMKAAAAAKIKRVILTSSTVAVGPHFEAMLDYEKAADKEKVYTAEDWNETDTTETSAYCHSKVLAEKKAWEMGKELGIEVVAINPGLVLGPVLSSSLWGDTVGMMVSLLKGEKEKVPEMTIGIVDVRDVAFAHVAGMEVAEAKGNRFLLTHPEGQNFWEVSQMLAKGFKAYALPKEGKEPVYRPKYEAESTEKVLKVKLRPVATTVNNMAKNLIDVGIVERKVLLKTPKWGKVKDLNPESRGVNLMAKVISCTTLEQKERGQPIVEAVVGDDTGIVTLRLSSEVTVGKTVAIQNCFVQMIGQTTGYIRVRPGKWGKVAEGEAEEEIEPKTDHDLSATEYELVAS